MTKPARALGQTTFVSLQDLFKADEGVVVTVDNGSLPEHRQPVKSSMEKLKARTDTALMRIQADLDGRVLQTILPMWDDENRGVPNPIIR